MGKKSKKSDHSPRDKKKHSKKYMKKHASSDSSDSESVEMEWVEANAPKKAQRENWMTEESFVPTLSKEEMRARNNEEEPMNRRKLKMQQQLETNKKIQEARELNPHLKNKAVSESEATVENLHLSSSSVGDGGYSWLVKAYRRIQEQAKEEGRSMEEIAVERWGSLDKLLSMINDAKQRMKQNLNIGKLELVQSDDFTRSKKFIKPSDNNEEYKSSNSSRGSNEHPKRNQHSGNREFDRNYPKSINSGRSERWRKPESSERYQQSRASVPQHVDGRGHSNSSHRSSRRTSTPSSDSEFLERHQQSKKFTTSHSSSGKDYKGSSSSRRGSRRSISSSSDSDSLKKNHQSKRSTASHSSSNKGYKHSNSSHRDSRHSTSSSSDSESSEKNQRSKPPHSSSVKSHRYSNKDSRCSSSSSSSSVSEEDSSHTSTPERHSRRSKSSEHYSKDSYMKFRKPNRDNRNENKHYFASSKQTKKNYISTPDDELENKIDCQESKFEGYKEQNEARNISNSNLINSSENRKDHHHQKSYFVAEENHNFSKKEEDDCKDQMNAQQYTHTDLLYMTANWFRAELDGDMALAEKFKKRVEEMKEAGVTAPSSAKRKEREEVYLTKMDRSGMSRPVSQTQRNPRQKGGNYKKQKYSDYAGQYSLKQMFEREKLITSADNEEMFMEAAIGYDDTFNDNEVSDISDKITKKMSYQRQEEKDIKKAMHQHQRMESALERCIYCLDQPKAKKHLIVNKKEKVYVCLPDYIPMVEGHCLIVPNSHVPSFLHLDEDEWKEVESLKNSLEKLFSTRDKYVIFIETSMNFYRHPHTVIECIPIPKDTGELAPMYFKKAILEAEGEWTQNKKLVDLSKKDLYHSIPRNLPYFCVQFDPKIHAGFAHVVEDEKRFPRNFGKEVIGGMLDIDYNHLYKNRKPDTSKQVSAVIEFRKLWEKLL